MKRVWEGVRIGWEGVGITGELATLAESRIFSEISKVQTLTFMILGLN